MTHNEPTEEPNYALRKFLISIIGAIIALFLTGYSVGYTKAVLEHRGVSATDIAMMGAVAALIALTAFVCWKLWPKGHEELISPSVKKSRGILIGASLFGVVIGIAMSSLGVRDLTDLLSDGPVSPMLALAIIVAWLTVTPAITWIWWRNIDEHEAKAYTDSSAIAVHVYLFLVPSWWMATRAGLLPEQNPMMVLVIISAIWLVVWIYRKFA